VGLRLAALGTSLDVELGGPRVDELDARMRALWSRCLVPDCAAPSARLTIDLLAPDAPSRFGESHLEGSDLERLMNATTQAITRTLIAARAGELLMFHAGAVSHPSTGRSLVYVAAGGTGKTTLTRMLGTRYSYLTDETVGLAGDRVLPYPKPLSIRDGAAPTKTEHPPDALGLLPHAEGAATAAGVLLLDRDDSHTGEPEVTELGLLDAITELAPQSSSLYALPRGLHACADLIAATGPVLRVRYGEAATLAGLAADLIGAPT